jgi:hypothetical protein
MWFCRARKGSSALWQVSTRPSVDECLGTSVIHTSTVAWFGRTTFIFPSLPTMASHIWSKGGVSSSSSTVKRGLSHRVMPFGSSYRKIRFSKSSSSYPPSFSLSASSLVLISRHLSAGVPTCTSGTVRMRQVGFARGDH